MYCIYGIYCISMPQVTFYLRIEDLDKWKNLSNKAEFIHIALNDIKTTPAIVKPEPVTQSKIDSIKAMVPGMLTAADLAPKIKQRGLCNKCASILDIRGRCLNKNCKMSKN